MTGTPNCYCDGVHQDDQSDAGHKARILREPPQQFLVALRVEKPERRLGAPWDDRPHRDDAEEQRPGQELAHRTDKSLTPRRHTRGSTVTSAVDEGAVAIPRRASCHRTAWAARPLGAYGRASTSADGRVRCPVGPAVLEGQRAGLALVVHVDAWSVIACALRRVIRHRPGAAGARDHEHAEYRRDQPLLPTAMRRCYACRIGRAAVD